MDCSATSALKAQKVTEWAFPRETEGIVKTWLLSFSLLIHCDLTESREIFHLYSIRCTRSSFCMHANNFHSWSFFGIFSMYKQLAKSGACAAYWHPNSYCHSLHFEFLPDISKRLHMPNSPNAANAMTDPATCHANFLLWNSPKHSSNYVELTVTHGSMLISNFAASNHFTMFKSNITLYHFVSLSWEIPESPNWVVGPARGLAKEAAPQLAKITKKKKDVYKFRRFLWPLRHATKNDNILALVIWFRPPAQRPADNRGLVCTPQPTSELNHSQLCMFQEKPATSATLQESPKCGTLSIPLPESALIHTVQHSSICHANDSSEATGFFIWFFINGHRSNAVEWKSLLAKTPRQLVKQGASTVLLLGQRGGTQWSVDVLQPSNCWCLLKRCNYTAKDDENSYYQSLLHLVTCSYLFWTFVDGWSENLGLIHTSSTLRYRINQCEDPLSSLQGNARPLGIRPQAMPQRHW